MPQSATLDDYRWLTSAEGRVILADLSRREVAVSLVARLRQRLSPSRVHLVLEQVELRRRGRAKFQRADEMFFTRTLLEQATDERIAAYKASRLPEREAVADLCCGVGGDLISFGQRGPAIGIDRDPVAALFAQENARVHGQQVGTLAMDAEQLDIRKLSTSPPYVQPLEIAADKLADVRLLHVDPDRRAAGRRTTRLEFHSPDRATIERCLNQVEGAAVKLAPATVVPDEWAARAELEWIGCGGECRQQVAWFGLLARRPGQRAATVLPPNGPPRTLLASDSTSVPLADAVGAFLFEPHAAVLAAGLTETLANQHQLKALAAGVAYFTSDTPVHDPAVAAFRVLDVLPLDVKRLRTVLRKRDVGTVEIKKRGIDIEPEQLRKRLRLSGSQALTLILFRDGDSAKAVLAQRALEPT